MKRPPTPSSTTSVPELLVLLESSKAPLTLAAVLWAKGNGLTLTDLAHMLGVSNSTVYHALQYPEKASPWTVSEIGDAIGYPPPAPSPCGPAKKSGKIPEST